MLFILRENNLVHHLSIIYIIFMLFILQQRSTFTEIACALNIFNNYDSIFLRTAQLR